MYVCMYGGLDGGLDPAPCRPDAAGQVLPNDIVPGGFQAYS